MDTTTGSSYTESDLEISSFNESTTSTGDTSTLTSDTSSLSTESSNDDSTLSSGSSISVGRVTNSMSKLALKSVGSNLNDAASQDGSASDEEATTDDEDDDSYDEELISVVPHVRMPRKSITIIESGEESDSEDPNDDTMLQVDPIKPSGQTKPKTFGFDLATSNLAAGVQKPEMKKGIKKIALKGNQLGKETRSDERAEEKERLQRLEAKRKLFQRAFPSEDPDKSPILDFNAKKKKVLVCIDDAFVPHMKPHQLAGVKFMYDCVIEDVNELEEDEIGRGCILAHTIDLGKTFQVIVFLHTILTNRFIEEHISRVLIIVPCVDIEKWAQEFDKWFDKCGLTWQINIYEMRSAKTIAPRVNLLRTWFKRGGILLISGSLFRATVAAAEAPETDKRHGQVIREALLSPGPDLVLVSDIRLLKNDDSAFNKALSLIETNRRIVLTAMPLQNNLTEYFVMVDFIKPNLLGDKKEFRNRFQNPIEKGQHEDSNRYQVHEMKKRIHVLFEMLKGCIHRCGYNILVPYLQPKKEYVLNLKMTKLQIEMYRHYLKHYADKPTANKLGRHYLRDKEILSLIWNHPALLHHYYLESTDKHKSNYVNEKGTWYDKFLEDINDIYDIAHSPKFDLLIAILEMCEKKGDKLVIFSQSLLALNLIELMLKTKMEEEDWFVHGNALSDLRYKEIRARMGGVSNCWVPETDYHRIDGSVDSSDRSDVIEHFNDAKDTRCRLMLVSTKAAGIGTNLVGANRAIIFDASFNPALDLQAIFRIYRLSQTKPVYIYRFIAYGTMEEKLYKRQIVKMSLAGRVLDEQQIDRHYKKNDLREMYKLDTVYDEERVLPMCDDDLLNDLLFDSEPLIVSWHEHDTLLENKPEEDLTEEERIAAWTEYEEARNGPATGGTAAEEAFNKQKKGHKRFGHQ